MVILEEEMPPDYKIDYIPYEYKGTITTNINAIHYLNGEPYSQTDFEQIKAKLDLKNELSTELFIAQTNTQKVKI